MTPKVSIITTVYDRVNCLTRCIRALQHSEFADFEQLVVSDHPPEEIRMQIAKLVWSIKDSRVHYFNLPKRINDWGIAPATRGLRHAVGEYVCFLSDDNAYLSHHLGPLVAALDADESLGFAYSSCQYAPRGGEKIILNQVPSSCGSLDLGQPLFRRSAIRAAFGGVFPFAQSAWDWELIQGVIQAGFSWKHVDVPSFIFRLEAYPEHVEALA
jgi:glycosyltransferase involved in cell wall biosynthesis